MKGLCVLILQYNSSGLTLQLLESIEKIEGTYLSSYRVIVMDNASNDPKQDEITSRFPFVEFVRFEENHGFAKAHNIIWERIKEKWTLMLNNDCILLNDAINKTLKAAEENSADFATCALFNKDGSRQITFSSQHPPLLKILFECTSFDKQITERLRLKREKSRIGFASGAFLLIKTGMFRRVGMFDEKFFMYAEDIDLMIRLRKAGAKGYLFNSGRATHLEAGSASKKWSEDEIWKLKMARTLDVYETHYPAWRIRLWFRTVFLISAVWLRVFNMPEGAWPERNLAYKEEFEERIKRNG